MAGSVNKVILVGALGRDPEVRATQDGREIVTLNVATSESWKDKGTGERREKTEWHKVVIFNEGLGKVVQQYTRKGSKLYVEGQLQTRKWVNKEGNDQYSTEIVLQNFNGKIEILSKVDGNSGRPEEDDDEPPHSAPVQRRSIQETDPELDDEIPF